VGAYEGAGGLTIRRTQGYPKNLPHNSSRRAENVMDSSTSRVTQSCFAGSEGSSLRVSAQPGGIMALDVTNAPAWVLLPRSALRRPRRSGSTGRDLDIQLPTPAMVIPATEPVPAGPIVTLIGES